MSRANTQGRRPAPPRASPRLSERLAPLKDSLRATAKELVWLTVRYEHGSRPDIFLFCTRRGGSTWLMEMIGANRGILPLNQPLELLTPNLTPYQYRRLPKFDRGQIVHPDGDQERELVAYADDVMAGRIRVNAPHAFWRSGFRWQTDRLLLKVCDAKPMIDWFDARYSVDIVFLVRHPVAQALSCLRNEWATTTAAYLDNERFVDEVFDDVAMLGDAERIQRSGGPLERYVLNWVVENLYPLRVLAQRPRWLALSYEECVADQERVITRVSERLALPDVDRMRRAAQRASRSSGMSTPETVDAIRAGNRDALTAGWRKRVSAEDLSRVDRILDRFGVTLYSTASSFPNWSGYLPS